MRRSSGSPAISAVAFLLLAVLFLTPVLMAQKGASKLEGVVKDSTGAVIPGASITAKNIETGLARESVSNEEGYYVFPALPAGSYNVTAELTGFKKVVVEKLKLDIAGTHVQNFALAVGDITETVVVTGASVAPIQTTTSDIADTVLEQTIQLLPLNGRQPLDLIALNAGIAGNASQSERGSAAGQGTNYAGLGANGARAVSNAVYLDGVDITNSELGTGSGIGVGTELLQSVDAIGEFRVISSNASAEFGKNSGLQIEIVTRSGTNNLRGSLYHFHRNTIFNANKFFNNTTGVPRSVLLRNQFGGTVGGPVYFPWLYNGKNRTFFFFNYEGFRQSEGETVERTVLTPEARAGNFRYNNKGANSTALVDPITGQVLAQFAGQIGSFKPDELDRTRWDGIGKDASGAVDRYIKLSPLPNYYGNPGGARDGLNFASYRFNAPSPETRGNFVAKIDHQLFQAHQLSGRYSHGSVTRNANNSPFPGLESRERLETQRGIALSLVSAFTPTTTNEARLGFSRNLRTFGSSLKAGNILLDCDDTFDCLGTTNPDLTGEPSLTARQTWQVTDNYSFGRGSHQFKAGFTFRSTPLNVREDSLQLNLDFNSEPRNEQGAVVDLSQLIPGTAPYNTNQRIPMQNYFNFITGRVGGVYAYFNAAGEKNWGALGSARVRGFRQRELGFFMQDDWRVVRNLTFNMGLRYELFFVPYEVNSFWATPINRNLLDPQIDVNLVAAPIQFGTIGPKNGKQIYPDDFNNLAPSFGFSWDPFGDGKTAIRGAYRLSYDKLFTGTFNTIDSNIPGLNFQSVINGDSLRNAGLFTKLAPGGLNSGQKMTPRLADLKGTSVGGINLNGTFDLGQYLGLGRDKGGNLPSAPLGNISDTRQSASPYSFTRDFRTAYGQTWSFSIQREISRGTIIEARYIGRKGTKEYLGLPANEFRAPASYVKEMRELQYLLTGGSLGLKPGTLPTGYVAGTSLQIGQLFGTSPNNATNYSQFVPGTYNDYAFKTFPLLYPFFLAGTSAFDNAVASPLVQNNYVSVIATVDNSTAWYQNDGNLTFIKSVPANAVPSGKGLNANLGPNRTPAADPRWPFGALPIIVGIQENIFRPNPQFLNGPRVTGNAAFSNYHAFQFQIQRRFYKGLQFQGNYTLSKNFDITSVSQPTGQDVVSFYSVFQDYAVSDNDVTHNVKVNFIWDAPVGRTKRFLRDLPPVLNHILGGWQVAAFFESATDFPYNIAVNGQDRTAPPTTGGIRPSWAAGYKANGATNDIGQVQKRGNGVYYFDRSDFNSILGRTLLGELGNVDRNMWRGPGFWNVDMNLTKVFKLSEVRQLEFRAEFFNLFNHANFANPSLNAPNGPYVDLSNSDAGKIIDTLGNPRLMQFALKLRF